MKRKQTHIAHEVFIITRVFDAPRGVVFNAFTDPEHLMRWWGPKGFTMVFCKLDLRPGGMFHYCAKSAEGNPLWGRFVYREVLKEKRIVFVNSFSNESGYLKPTPFPGWPQEMLNKVTFKEENGKTIITFTSEAINASEDERNIFVAGFKKMKQGYNGTFDELENYLQTITAKMLNHECK